MPSSNNSNPSTKNHETISKVHVSAMATNLAKPDDSPYYIGFEKVRADAYDALTNPDGIIQLGLSENTLSLDLLKDWLSKNFNDSLCRGSDDGLLNIKKIAPYQIFDGTKELKEVMASFMSQVMGTTTSFNPSQLVITCGANPAIEILCFCLAEPGDAFLIPAPYYPGFNRDMRFRTGVELIPVHAQSSDNFIVKIDALEKSYDEATKQGKQVKGILFSNPSNPVGNIFTKQTLHSLLAFARQKNIHIVSDEIYAGSTYGDQEFISMAEILTVADATDKDRVHIVYGLSKDFCMPGFRLGAVYTWNEQVLIASKKFSRFCSVPLPIQQLLVSMLLDTDFTREFMKTNKERLKKRYEIFVQGLEEMGMGYTKGSAGLYCWVDMRRLMNSIDEEGELELWDKLLNVAKISVTPGAACHCAEPGWFRCCFARLSEEDVRLVLQRIRRVVEAIKT